ncbi:MAG: hypothetical protein RLZZ600_73 [Actinomycetota bacterium]
MSVPEALTAILTLGDAYGLQLHAELGARLPHRSKTNVGQIYSTLERLVRDGLVERSGETQDGLPLYAATAAGATRAKYWLAGNAIDSGASWTEILDVVLLGSTLAPVPLTQACDHIESISWTPTADDSLSKRASLHFESAVRALISDVRQAQSNGTLPVRGLDHERPVRGRRPQTNN